MQQNPTMNIYGEAVQTEKDLERSLRNKKTLEDVDHSEYELHTVWLSKEPLVEKNAVYSDRLAMEGDKYNRLARLHFGDISHLWNRRKPAQIEAFLADFFALPPGSVKLTQVTKERNRANGQHIWALFYAY